MKKKKNYESFFVWSIIYRTDDMRSLFGLDHCLPNYIIYIYVDTYIRILVPYVSNISLSTPQIPMHPSHPPLFLKEGVSLFCEGWKELKLQWK